MKKRIGSGLLALLLTLWLCLPLAAAAQPTVQVGQAVADGSYEITYRSDLDRQDVTHAFYYSEHFFDHAATQYDHQLALATLGMALAAGNTYQSDEHYWLDGEQGREENIRAAYQTLGFANAKFYRYDSSPNHYVDRAGYSFAQKTLTVGGKTRTVVAAMMRGAGYGCEWASNMHVGSGTAHEGFAAAADEAFRALQDYLAQAAAAGELGEVKLWISGYSRGGAVANLLAARIANGMPELSEQNVYVYTFAAPAAITADSDAALKKDFDNNHDASGTLKKTWDESNIFNIVSSGDLVPRVLPDDWGYYRNGNDRFLPSVSSEDELLALNAHVEAMRSDRKFDFHTLPTKEDVDTVIAALEKACGDKQGFYEKYQDMMMDLLECAFIRSEDEVLLGIVSGDEAVIDRLSKLSNMGQFSLLTITRNVWLSATMSRALLERFGEDVPLRAQQVVEPLLAVGLCYGLDGSILQALIEIVMSYATSGAEGDQLMNVASCHYPENYIAMMECYDPFVHGMQAYTRE